MTELLTAAQMRAIETAAIESGSVTGLELMERAGQGVVDAVFSEWPDLAKGSFHAVILCGPGNNGGDGFVVARLLRDAGWDVGVFLYGDAEKLPPDAKMNYERWVAIGDVCSLSFPTLTRDEIDQVGSAIDLVGNNTTICIDALFGTGLSRPIDGIRRLIEETSLGGSANEQIPPFIVSVDVPTGICADSGRTLGNHDEIAVGAHLTVTFQFAKIGHLLDIAGMNGRRLRITDLGLDKFEARRVLGAWPGPQNGFEKPDNSIIARSVEEFRFEPAFNWGKSILDKVASAHKYSHGHALILSGDQGHTGAARLAARGALRIGAGVVTVGSPPDALAENAAHLTAVMLAGVHDGDALARVLKDERINALCLGPALGLSDDKAVLIRVALAAGRAMVLDADALTIVSREPDLFAGLHETCVLTPHAGEFGRLFPDISEKLNAPATTGPAYSKVDATRDAAKRAGCVVLFKGPDTVIASPDGRCSINSSAYARSAPWLATAGSGDVLAGFITGLLARGFVPHRAAEAGAFLHTECALSFGAGLIAEDLPEELPKVFRALGL
ncbi:NAD(P)H-hydrate dehydratase [Octadecabacter sp. 1_MG-2023]|uniref:NAD(P)H-hydrate dehydratase n=1 Tax=unclassified Octadecabacter TaxID=196158 RepID=UPI001C09F28E|nr:MULTISPECIES: NAD(P)H-hydrate dehydratase [unclassified Octadecabacter]MBU2993727.1 NAD(P)H-hydrate dehydratase [Octadecabacter sp. B2R22]MDO6735429.1 NAD(P)H-hydrate dehydratase [Octadecabacter sp. 1_MG-2023]